MPSLWKAFSGAVLALAFTAAPAHAQLLTFVSATGADMRPCTVQAQPCRTLQRANDATTAGGEIRLLSSLPNQAATIDKSLTVSGGGHTMIGEIAIDSATAVVTLRNLGLNARNNNATGIHILNAAVVRIENSAIERYSSNGIRLAASVSTELFISDSVVRDNGFDGLSVGAPTTAKLTIDRSRFENNAQRGVNFLGGELSASDSVFSGNTVGITMSGGRGTVANSVAVGGTRGFVVEAPAELTLESSVASDNAVQGIFVETGATARISASAFIRNDTGIENNGTVLTIGDNIIAGNSSADVTGSALTPLAAQ